jgi:hypothetical protein
MYERIPGFEHAREPHPSTQGVADRNRVIELLDDWGGVINSGPVSRGPIRLTDLYKVAAKHAKVPSRCPSARARSTWRGTSTSSTTRIAKELSYALVPIFNAEMKDLVAAGAKYLQIEDLGAWLPLFTGNKDDYKWIKDVIEKCCEGVDAKIGWHFCFGNAWGNDILSGNFPRGIRRCCRTSSRQRGSMSSCSISRIAR